MFANTMKTGLLMFGLVALFTAIGGLLGNQTGALIASYCWWDEFLQLLVQ